MKKLLLVANVGWAFVSHRMPIGIAARAAGYEVHVATALDPRLDVDTERRLSEARLALHTMKFSRSGVHPFEILREIVGLFRLYRRLRPDVVHLITLKPVLLGGFVCRLLGHDATVFAIPGRGSVFSSKGLLASLRRRLVLWAYRFCYRPGRSKVIVQNIEDRDYFINNGIFESRDVRLIRGAGVDLASFWCTDEPRVEATVVLASRMLREKGIEDFVKAAHILKAKGLSCRLLLVGEPDNGNPHSHTEDELKAWVAQGAVEWLGLRSDMQRIFAESNIVCLPTYYGEGVPKVLIEAAASCRAIVTTDIPGCRDIVRHGVNGLLVPPRNPEALADALGQLIQDRDLRERMGAKGRELVQSEFTLAKVTAQTLAIYNEQGH